MPKATIKSDTSASDVWAERSRKITLPIRPMHLPLLLMLKILGLRANPIYKISLLV
jgi:hypothetical protein